MARASKQLVCSFSGVTADQTVKLIQVPEVRICAECVHLCADILGDADPRPSVAQRSTLVLEDGTRHLVSAGLHEAVRCSARMTPE